MNLENTIRKLSKTNYYQTIYSQEKNLGICLFRNKTELLYIQIIFLNYLAFYSALYFDYSMGDVDDMVFEDYIYEDSYMLFRRKDKNKMKENKNSLGASKLKSEQGRKNKHNKHNKQQNQEQTTTSQWVFKTPKRVK